MIFQLFSLQGKFHYKWCVLIVCPVSIKSERGRVYNGGPITGYRDTGYLRKNYRDTGCCKKMYWDIHQELSSQDFLAFQLIKIIFKII